MAGSLNKVMVIGYVGRDAELRYLPSGTPVARFSVAATDRWRTENGELQERTEWFRVVAWRKLAETCGKWVTKGRKVYVEGRLHTNTFDGQDGQKHTVTEVIALDMSLLDRPHGGVATADDAVADDGLAAPSEHAF